MPASRAPGQQRSGEHVGFDVDHHDVATSGATGQRVADAGGGVAGGVDDDLDAVTADECSGVFGQVRRAVAQGLGEGGGSGLLQRPADPFEGGAGASEVEVANADHMQPRRAPRLRQKHRGELARADDADTDRPVGSLLEKTMKVHWPTIIPGTPPAPAFRPAGNESNRGCESTVVRCSRDARPCG